MIFRLAIRSLLTRPVRTAVLASGFGFGIAVMAALLGVGEVILEQAHSPALRGGGDLVVLGRFGSIDSARFLMTSVLGSPKLAHRAAAVSPSKRASVYLITDTAAIRVVAHGGIPSLEKAVGDPEVSSAPDWIDAPSDWSWSNPDSGDILRAMDRFHRMPDAPEFAASWAEWLYFNGRSSDGRLRFYLTFLVGPASATPGRRSALVRLQLERDGLTRNYSATADVDGAAVLASAPDLDIGANRVRLVGLQYRITLALAAERASEALRTGPSSARPADLTGELVLDAAPGRSLPPGAIRGARGWISGYTAPVLSGTMRGALAIGDETLAIENAAGYHDHNWGFWKGVRWQWGQLAHDDLSFVYGRVFPPADVADPDRVPGVLAVLGAEGPIGFSTDVTIEETAAAGPDRSPDSTRQPKLIVVRARGVTVDLRFEFTVERVVRTAMSMTASDRETLDFLQMGGEYRVTGRIGDRSVDFVTRGAAETFRPR